MYEWISIKDQSYPVGTPILIRGESGIVTTAFYDPEPICGRPHWISWYGYYEMPGFKITHWMKIPAFDDRPISEVAKKVEKVFQEAAHDAVQATLDRGNYVVGTNKEGKWVRVRKDEDGNLVEEEDP